MNMREHTSAKDVDNLLDYRQNGLRFRGGFGSGREAFWKVRVGDPYRVVSAHRPFFLRLAHGGGRAKFVIPNRGIGKQWKTGLTRLPLPHGLRVPDTRRLAGTRRRPRNKSTKGGANIS